MGFGMKKTKFGFAPVIRCDICQKECMANNLNFEHNWECQITRIACKECCRERKYMESEAWMEMNEYVTSLVHNTQVDLKEGNKIIDRID